MVSKQGTFKNYIILFLLIIGTVIIALYVFSWIRFYNESKLDVPVIDGVLQEIQYDNLDEVLSERDFLIVYTCTTSEAICRNFEVNFKEYIIDNNLDDKIVYFRLGYDANVLKDDGLLNKIYNNYKDEDLVKKANDYPTLLVFSNRKIIDLISPNKNSKVSIKSVRDFLEGYDIY